MLTFSGFIPLKRGKMQISTNHNWWIVSALKSPRNGTSDFGPRDTWWFRVSDQILSPRQTEIHRCRNWWRIGRQRAFVLLSGPKPNGLTGEWLKTYPRYAFVTAIGCERACVSKKDSLDFHNAKKFCQFLNLSLRRFIRLSWIFFLKFWENDCKKYWFSFESTKSSLSPR